MSNSYPRISNSFPRISNSFSRIAIRSLELDNLFSRIAIRSLEFDNSIRENGLSNSRERIISPWEQITYPWERIAQLDITIYLWLFFKFPCPFRAFEVYTILNIVLIEGTNCNPGERIVYSRERITNPWQRITNPWKRIT